MINPDLPIYFSCCFLKTIKILYYLHLHLFTRDSLISHFHLFTRYVSDVVLSDGKFHTLFVIKRERRVSVYIDDVESGSIVLERYSCMMQNNEMLIDFF